MINLPLLQATVRLHRINSPHDISIHSIFQRRSISFGFYASFLQAQKYVTVFDRLYFCIRKLFIFFNYCWKIPNTLSHQMHFIAIVQKAFYQIERWWIQHHILINENSYHIFFCQTSQYLPFALNRLFLLLQVKKLIVSLNFFFISILMLR